MNSKAETQATPPTPCLVVQEKILDRNIAAMQERSSAWGVQLYPHIKTHKSLFVAQKQIAQGAQGLTCAKLSEAEVFAEAGFRNIFVANQIVDRRKKHRFCELQEMGGCWRVGLDTLADACLWHEVLDEWGINLQVMIEVDVGLGRSGVALADVDDFLVNLANYPRIQVAGCFSHGGQVYGARTPTDLLAAAQFEADSMARLKGKIGDGLISIGSTPGLLALQTLPHGIDEIRPGNYVFFDRIAAALGACTLDDIALRLMSQIISVHPDRTIIDAGSKSLGLDRGAHANEILDGFGWLSSWNRAVTRVSEEHGIIKGTPLAAVGEFVEILPNHSCYVTNLFRCMYVASGGGDLRVHPVDAQGCCL